MQDCSYCGNALPEQYFPRCRWCGAPRSKRLRKQGVTCMFCKQPSEIEVPEGVSEAMGKLIVYVCANCSCRVVVERRIGMVIGLTPLSTEVGVAVRLYSHKVGFCEWRLDGGEVVEERADGSIWVRWLLPGAKHIVLTQRGLDGQQRFDERTIIVEGSSA